MITPNPRAENVGRGAGRQPTGPGGDRERQVRTTVDGTPWLDADPVRTRQAFGTLVSSALRHTPPGGTVRLAARRDGDAVVLDVTGTGTGIAPDGRPDVFDRFWRSKTSRSRRTGGSDPGLPIVRHLLAARGGTAEASSELGHGSVFTLRLPAGRGGRPGGGCPAASPAPWP
jgi:two-component system sensor histidine kinase BaeS